MNKLQTWKGLVRVFIRTSLQQEMAFRFNFFAKLLNTLIQLSGSVVSLLILFSVRTTVGGWSFYQILTVTGVFLLIQSISNLFIAPSLSAVSGLDGELWTGNFDFTLLKPVPTQLYISTKNWSLLSLPDVVISIVILVSAACGLDTSPGIGKVLAFTGYLAIALLLLYSVMLLLASAAFWYLGTPLLWILNSVTELGRFPVRIYPVALKNLLTWVVPIGIMITFPAEILLGTSNTNELCAGIILAITLFLAASAFFKVSVKKYSSASS